MVVQPTHLIPDGEGPKAVSHVSKPLRNHGHGFNSFDGFFDSHWSTSGFLFLPEPRGVPTCGAVGAEDDGSGFAVARDLVLHAVDAEDELVSADAGVVHAHHVEHPERGKEWECEPREGVWAAHVVEERRRN